MSIIDENEYVDRIIGRIPYKNQQTAQEVEKIAQFIKEYVRC
jgi:hypothetical protein